MRSVFFASVFLATHLFGSDIQEQAAVPAREHIYALDALRTWLLDRGITAPITEIAGKLIIANLAQYAGQNGAKLCRPLSPVGGGALRTRARLTGCFGNMINDEV